MEYRSEIDKCYSLAGIALGLMVFDAKDLLSLVDIDSEQIAIFTPQFYFEGNPRISAKDSWQARYANFQIKMGLAIASTMSRKMILDHGEVDKKLRRRLLDAMLIEGNACCQLDEDEVEPLFDREFAHLVNFFSRGNVRKVAAQIAQTIQQRRTISGGEICDMLANLDF